MHTIQERVERAKKAILDDIKEGIIPEDVKSFEALHEYIDANVYLNPGFKETFMTEQQIAVWNKVADELDKWLKGGRK